MRCIHCVHVFQEVPFAVSEPLGGQGQEMTRDAVGLVDMQGQGQFEGWVFENFVKSTFNNHLF